MKYYNSHGKEYTVQDFYDLEVDERENYTPEEFSTWQKKYGFLMTDKCIWVTPNPRRAISYMTNAEDAEMALAGANDDLIPDLKVYYKGVIIKESNDLDEGYLMILKIRRYEVKKTLTIELIQNSIKTKLRELSWMKGTVNRFDNKDFVDGFTYACGEILDKIDEIVLSKEELNKKLLDRYKEKDDMQAFNEVLNFNCKRVSKTKNKGDKK